MTIPQILGDNLYQEAKEYADAKFGNRKIATLIRIAVSEYIDREKNKNK